MLRTLKMVCPVLVAASFVADPALARPLTAEAEQANWGKDQFGPDQGQWDQGFGEVATALELCTQTQIFVGVGSRAADYDCDTLTGPACLAQCDTQADELAAACSSQCDDGGALFCAPSELLARWGGWNGLNPWGIGPWGMSPWGVGPWGGFNPIDTRPDTPPIEEVVFIDTATCLQLNVDDV